MGLTDTIRNIYKYSALLPTMPWKDAIPPNKPEELEVKRSESSSAVVTWKLPARISKDKDEIQSFVLYRVEDNEEINLENPKNIISIVRNNGKMSYVDRNISNSKKYFYIVTALDRLQNESSPSNKFYLK